MNRSFVAKVGGSFSSYHHVISDILQGASDILSTICKWFADDLKICYPLHDLSSDLHILQKKTSTPPTSGRNPGNWTFRMRNATFLHISYIHESFLRL